MGGLGINQGTTDLPFIASGQSNFNESTAWEEEQRWLNRAELFL